MKHLRYTRKDGDIFYEDTNEGEQLLFPFAAETIYKDHKVYDINGREIKDGDYVRTDELGWCGFAFYSDDDKDYILSITGSGGFSCDPYNIEWLGNPFTDEWSNKKMKEQCYKYEGEYMQMSIATENKWKELSKR